MSPLNCTIIRYDIIMTLINFTKEELQKIEYYLLGETDPIVMDILEKIGNLDDLCECGGKTN